MRVIAIIILSVLFFGPGCSGEEEPAHLTQKPKVVKPIIRPASPKSNTSVGVREVKPESEKKAAGAQSKTIKREAFNKPGPIAEKGKKTLKEEAGYYIVKKGDTLSSISGREDVYRDPLKWPILYRLNMDRLNKLKTGEDFPEKKLPAGVRLKIITQKKAKENRKKMTNKLWVVNVLSATTGSETNPVAIRLVKKGYTAYITRARVNGKDWIRLRVGFFSTKADAESMGQKIMKALHLNDSWPARIGPMELKEFAGY